MARLLGPAFAVLCLGSALLAGVAEDHDDGLDTAFDTRFARRIGDFEFRTDVQGFCQHQFGAKLRGGWTLLRAAAIDAALASSSGSREEAALSLAPSRLPETQCHQGMLGSGNYSLDGSLFNVTQVCAPQPGNAGVRLGELDSRDRPSTCGCLQAPQCSRGNLCSFDCACRSVSRAQLLAVHARLLAAEAILYAPVRRPQHAQRTHPSVRRFHAELDLERGFQDSVTCSWNTTLQRRCFAASGGRRANCTSEAEVQTEQAISDAMTSPTTASGVHAAAVNGSWPLHQVALEGYVLEVFPAATPNNELLSLCVDPEAVSADHHLGRYPS